MISELLYYILPLTLGVGIYYYSYPTNAKTMAVNVAWNVSKSYIRCCDLKDRVSSYLGIYGGKDGDSGKDCDSGEDCGEDCDMSIILYNGDKQSHLVTTYDPDATMDEEIDDISPSIMFITKRIRDSIFFKRTNNPKNTDLYYDIFKNKPFIQVELVEPGVQPVDIHSNLPGFYVNGNIILDKSFLEWYLKYYYDRDLPDEYTIRIFDKDVNMFSLSKGRGVILKDDKYNIIYENGNN
jgi:hypothetical protein